MQHKVGDLVRIRPLEWFDAQEKNSTGELFVNNLRVNYEMQEYAGKLATIVGVFESCYSLLVDAGRWLWFDSLFDPSFDPYALLSAEEAILAMVEGGETLRDEDGDFYVFDKQKGRFCATREPNAGSYTPAVFDGLRRRIPKSKRRMTGSEALAWAYSKDSLGWMARSSQRGDWCFPREFGYVNPISDYQRAQMLPDRSGIDRGTIQGFEAEE
jgi:hypothetical protein